MKLQMRWTVFLALALAGGTPSAQAASVWRQGEIAILREELAKAPAEGLPPLDTRSFEQALDAGDAAAIDKTATSLAETLVRQHLLGGSRASDRAGWKIVDSDARRDLPTEIATVIEQGQLARYFLQLRPRHPDYAVLQQAYAKETDGARRAQLARNLERWRWMPNDLGADFVLVNAAGFDAALWRDGVRLGKWRVIVGKPKTPTAVFSATISGVTLNPWWDVPANIVRESVGALVRRHPALARQRGYVWGGGRYRQRPGPGNALGQMKLVMPNPYSIYLHDTPSKDLFARDVRAFSHGCIRVDDALGFARQLLAGTDRVGEVDALVARGETVTLPLLRQVPVYIAYFTVVAGDDATPVFLADIYGRDGRGGVGANAGGACPA